MNKDRRDFDDIKMTDEELIEASLDDLVQNPDDMDVDDSILDDDFSEPAPRPRKRQSVSLMTLVLLLVAVLVGGAYLLLSNDTVTRALSTPPSSPATPAPVAAAVPPAPETSMPPEMPAVNAATPVPDASFADLPQPNPVSNADASAPVEMPVEPPVATTPDMPATPPTVETPVAVVEPETIPTAPATVPAAETPAPVPAMPDMPAQPDVSAMATPPVAVPAPAETMPAMPVVPESSPDSKELTAETEVAVKPAEKPADVVANKTTAEKPAAEKTAPVKKPEVKKPATPSLPPAAPTMGAAPVSADTVADEYMESLAPAQDIAKQTERKITLPPADDMGRAMGMSVESVDAPSPERDLLAANRALELGRNESALEMFDAIYKKNPRDERVLMGRAVALQKLGREEEAIRSYEELLTLKPDSPEVMTNMLGLVRKQYPSVALQRLLELRQKYPDNPTVAAQAGLANASIGNLAEGLRYLSIAASLEPANPKHFFNMAVIAERMGSPDQAIGYYEKALQTDALNDAGANRVNRDVIYDRLSVLRQR